MPTIMEYLDWRGDLPFTAAPLNEVDEFILCKIGTPDLRGIVPHDGTYVPIARAAEVYLATGGELKLGVVASKHTVPVFRRLGDTVRFGDLMLSGYRLTVNETRTEQFSALTVRLPGGQHVVTFRGTDDTLVGWKENFLLTVRDATSAQEHAARYLRWAAETYPGKLILAGHSKGGNLAVYAAAMAPPEIQDRIERVCCFDGPGFFPDFFRQEGFLRIRDKIRCLIPQSAMIGTLLFQGTEQEIVKSETRSLPAHDGYTWVASPGGFVRAEELTPAARAYDKAMKEVLTSMTVEQREAFIEEFFGTLSASGAVTLTDVTDRKLREVWQMMRSLQQEPEVRRLLTDMAEAITKGYAAERGLDLTKLRVPGLPRRFRKRETPPAAEE